MANISTVDGRGKLAILALECGGNCAQECHVVLIVAMA
jgi:hypothetical protein